MTPAQKKIYTYIQSYLSEHGHSPSLREIAEGIGISPKSVSLISRSIHALVDAGKLQFDRKGYRNLQLIPEVTGATLPLVGRIAAGQPIEAIQDDQLLDVNAMLKGEGRFALQVKGDSMVEDGILDGDYVICQPSSHAKENEIVVALIDGQDATLKRISYQIKHHIALIPANATMKPKAYAPHRVTIQAVCVGVLRIPARM